MNRDWFCLVFVLLFILPFPSKSQEFVDRFSMRDLSDFLIGSRFQTDFPDSLYAHSDRGLKTALQSGDKQEEALMYRYLGIYHWINADIQETMKYFQKAKGIYDSLGLMNDAMELNSYIGILHSTLGDYVNAVDCYYKSLRYFEDNTRKNKEYLADTYNALGLVLGNINDYTSALSNFRRSYNLFSQLEDTLGIAVVYANLGTVSVQIHQFDSAKYYFTNALRLFERLNNAKGIAFVYNKLVGTAHREGRISDAFLYAQIAYGISLERGFVDCQVSALISMGKVKYEQGRFREAFEYFSQANSIKQPYGNKWGEVDIFKGLYKSSKALGNFEEAFSYNDMYIAVMDSLYSNDSYGDISKLRISNEVGKRDAEIRLLAKDSEIEKLNRRSLVFRLIGAIVVLFLISIILLVKNKKNRILAEQKAQLVLAEQAIINAKLQNRIEREVELSKELDSKNRELITYTLNLMQKNAILDEVKAIAKEVLKRPSAKDQELRKLINAIDYSFTLDKDWDGFKTYFEQVHPDFFKKLKDSYPSLSASELRHCALINLSLSIKETAQLLSISPDSVKVARHRIRKKLNLKLDDNLTEFIMSI
ncbi:tetratricopeptide repeat protein [Cytophagales bacterium LB-30]|uniref:Tetratricopeptide repeat protein n=1 Tax=Shiella aurantiaca TaxID=3058365 RepID=A0ABT8F2V1_9BACT|nr:tetratricopeptide repeat protein [Shiella aurantiaca]MDN4164785.1 tetratricopeptide repeat protein [Shiella aurantiaca]